MEADEQSAMSSNDKVGDDIHAMLADIDDVPLAERVEAFDQINRRIVSRLAEFDGI